MRGTNFGVGWRAIYSILVVRNCHYGGYCQDVAGISKKGPFIRSLRIKKKT